MHPEDSPNQNVVAQIESLEAAAIETLTFALTLGDVIIVTNAMNDWIQYSQDVIFPRLYAFMKDNRVPILSARELYQADHPTQPVFWKINCFREQIEKTKASNNGYLPSLVVSIGDGLHEKIACRVVSTELQVQYRCIKLIEAPHPSAIVQQLQCIIKNLKELSNISEKLHPDYNLVYNSDGAVHCSVAAELNIRWSRFTNHIKV